MSWFDKVSFNYWIMQTDSERNRVEEPLLTNPSCFSGSKFRSSHCGPHVTLDSHTYETGKDRKPRGWEKPWWIIQEAPRNQSINVPSLGCREWAPQRAQGGWGVGRRWENQNFRNEGRGTRFLFSHSCQVQPCLDLTVRRWLPQGTKLALAFKFHWWWRLQL